MQTNSSRNRKRLLLTACCTLTLAALCYFLYYECGDRVRALSWHRQHGDYLAVGIYRLKLPSGWWPAFTYSDGTIFVWKAGGFMGLSSGIRIYPIAPDETVDDTNRLASTEQRMVSMMNRSGTSAAKPKPASLVEIKSPSATFECVEETLYDNEFLLHCQAARVPYRIESAGEGKWEQETLSVLATWE